MGDFLTDRLSRSRAYEPDIRPPPAAEHVEQRVLGAWLRNASGIPSDIDAERDFAFPGHKEIARAILEKRARGEWISPHTITQAVQHVTLPPDADGHLRYLEALFNSAPTSSADVEDLHRDLKRFTLKRHQAALADAMLRSAYDHSEIAPEAQLVEFEAEMRSARERVPSASATADLVFLDDIEEEPDRLDVIDGMISAASVGAVYGEWSAGKTFFAIHVMFCIALGRPCMGREVDRGSALYVPFEGLGRLGRRLKAARAEYGDPGAAISYLKEPGSIRTEASAALFVQKVTMAAAEQAKRSGLPSRLIVIDTLAAAMAGATGNDEEVMTLAVKVGEEISRRTGASVIYVAHPGKNLDRGPRGNYAFPAGISDLIRIDKPTNPAAPRFIEQEKCRDGEPGPRGAYTLRTVKLGVDARGRDITTCLVEPDSAAQGKPKRPDRPAPNTQAGKALNELEHLMIEGRHTVSAGHPRIPDGAGLVLKREWRKACRARGLANDTHDDPKKKAEAENKAFTRALEVLEEHRLISDFGDKVWLMGHSYPVNADIQK